MNTKKNTSRNSRNNVINKIIKKTRKAGYDTTKKLSLNRKEIIELLKYMHKILEFVNKPINTEKKFIFRRRILGFIPFFSRKIKNSDDLRKLLQEEYEKIYDILFHKLIDPNINISSLEPNFSILNKQENEKKINNIEDIIEKINNQPNIINTSLSQPSTHQQSQPSITPSQPSTQPSITPSQSLQINNTEQTYENPYKKYIIELTKDCNNKNNKYSITVTNVNDLKKEIENYKKLDQSQQKNIILEINADDYYFFQNLEENLFENININNLTYRNNSPDTLDFNKLPNTISCMTIEGPSITIKNINNLNNKLFYFKCFRSNIELNTNISFNVLSILECEDIKIKNNNNFVNNNYFFNNIKNYAPYLTLLNCSSNKLTELNDIPDNLKYLKCSNNQIKELKKLKTLVYLDCSSNQLENLDNLPLTLDYLDCSSNQLQELVKLPNNLKYLDCSYNKKLERINLQNKINLEYLITDYSPDIKNNNKTIKKINILGLPDLDKLKIIVINQSQKSGTFNTKIESLHKTQPPNKKTLIKSYTNDP